jgi:SAM-dependent methyltransferase
MIRIEELSRDLRRAEDGIWYGREGATVSYPPQGHGTCFEVEEGSFWFQHRNDCITAAVKSHPPPVGGPIFDIGGGNGFVSLGLARAGLEVVLVEPGRAGARNAKRRGVEHVVCATLESAGFAEQALPACGLFDVLEHVEDDLEFLRSIRRLLRPGGRLYATVPAYSWLWSKDDELAGHYRRYRLSSLAHVVRRAGLEVDLASYFFRLTPLAILLLRTLPSRLGLAASGISGETVRRDHLTTSRRFNWILRPLLNLELRKVSRKAAMSFGGSCLLVARRPE